MAWKTTDLEFNGINLSDIGVTVISAWDQNVRGGNRSTFISTPSGPVWRSPAAPQPIQMQFNCRIAGDTPDYLAINIEALQAALKSTDFVILRYYYPDRHWLAMHSGEDVQIKFIGGWKDAVAATFTLAFDCQPVMVAETEITDSDEVDANPHTIYIPKAGTVAGAGLVYPQLILANIGAGIPEDTLEIYNYTRGTFIRYSGAIANGEAVLINCSTRQMGLSTDYGETWTDKTDLVSGSDTWLALECGVQNRIDFVGCADVLVNWSFTPHYE